MRRNRIGLKSLREQIARDLQGKGFVPVGHIGVLLDGAGRPELNVGRFCRGLMRRGLVERNHKGLYQRRLRVDD